MKKARQLPIFQHDLQVSRFLTLISPPQEIQDYVRSLKNQVADKYGDFDSRYSKAYLSVNSFLLAENRTPFVISSIIQRFSHFGFFELNLKNFSFFGGSNTLFLDVLPSKNFTRLINEYEELRKYFIKTKKFSASKTPHITIAKKLDLSTFRNIKAEYLDLEFNYIFEVQKLDVLKFDPLKQKYTHYCEIPLE